MAKWKAWLRARSWLSRGGAVTAGGPLAVLWPADWQDCAGPGSPAFQILTPERRRALRARCAAGALDSLRFRACTFRAQYPNVNYLRFRAEDLAPFAGSFTGVPFLRDHNAREIEARGGTVIASALDTAGAAPAFVQTIELTVPRAIEALLNGQMDRFSIAWDWSRISCSVCGEDWLSEACPHWPGRRYGRPGEEALCELVFEEPRGREVSAVNAPAVRGTGIWELELGEEGVEHEQLEGPQEHQARRSRRDPYDAGQGQVEQTTRVKEDGMVEAEETAASSTGQAVAVSAFRAGADPAQASTEPAAEPAAGAVAVELLEAQRAAVLEARLLAAGLPDELHDMVRAALPAGWRPRDLDGAIATAQAAWARLEAGRTVRGMAPRPGQGGGHDGAAIGGMLSSTDQVQLARDGLLGARRPERGVRPLSGIREFYVLMSGDYEMHGVFHPENIGLAAVDSSTMAGMVANALNKVIANQFQAFPRWWEPIVTVEDFATLQQVRWITLGGVGELPTVAEGASYTEMTWGDQTETADWVKKGGYLGITLEAIDKDDTRRIQQAGPALARAAWLSLGKAVAGIFTQAAGVGPTMSDSNALFHVAHANLGSTALSYASYGATRLLMRKQTELHSGERLGGLVVPRYLLVPPDLETTAVQIMASELEPAQDKFNENLYAEGNTHEARLAAARKRVIVVDFWSDASDWALVADPQLYPSIGLGFRFGREPEIFSVASANTGLMFTNDTLPVKVRFFFAVGPTDWRGLYKHNVA